MPDDRLTVTEKTALIMLVFASGAHLSTAQVARICGLSHHGAWRMLGKISRVVPLTFAGQRWHLAVNSSPTLPNWQP